MSQMTRTQKGHCWHPTGICLTQGLYGGSDEMVCCFCGVGGQQAWHIEMQSHKDHGPFWQVDDACAIARGEAQWTLGYRTRFEALAHDKLEADRLCAKNLRQWQDVERVERKFRRLALRLLRELSSRADP
jgi:hypothetical protein